MDLVNYVVANKIAHISIEDAEFDKIMQPKIRKLYEDDDDMYNVNNYSSVHKFDNTKMELAKVERNA